MDSRVVKAVTFRVGAFRRRIAWVFGLQFLIVAIVCMLGIYNIAHTAVVIVVIVITTAIAWFATRREWRPVRALARLVNRWDGQQFDPESLHLDQMSTHTDADVASLARGLHGFATRIADYNQRERNFTRDASHELRSPLTVIKMSVDMLADEDGPQRFRRPFGAPDQARRARDGGAGRGTADPRPRDRHRDRSRTLRCQRRAAPGAGIRPRVAERPADRTAAGGAGAVCAAGLGAGLFACCAGS